MKKVLLIVISMFCAVSVWAVSYASPYKGAGRNGGIYLTSGVRHATTAEGMAQTPQIAMSSVSRGVSMGGSSRGIVNGRMSTGVVMGTAVPVRGIYTSATNVTGGVTTYNHPHPGSVRKGSGGADMGDDPTPPDCGCHWEFDEENDKYVCPICGCEIEVFEIGEVSECGCKAESDYCWCPLDMNWGAMLFLALLAGGYAMWKRKGTIISGAIQKKYR